MSEFITSNILPCYHINKDICVITKEHGTIDEVIQCFMKFVDIVFIVKEESYISKCGIKRKLMGAITEGDIKRFFRSMGKISFYELINTNIKYIIYKTKKQIYKEAKEIFDTMEKINNIPVVDKSGNLLFQIDRYDKNVNEIRAINCISEACANDSLEVILNDGTQEIILTGGTINFLSEAKKIICQNLKKEINIKISENIDESLIINDKTIIISLNRLGFMYLYYIKNIRTDIITAQELESYFKLKDIYNVDKKIISSFMDTFKYRAIAFYPSNKYVCLFIKLVRACGLKVYNLSDEFLHNENDKKYINSSLDIFLISGNHEEYIEKMSIAYLMGLIRFIEQYKQLTGKFLKYNTFMQICINHILDMQKMKVMGFLHVPVSLWGKELNDNIKNNSNLEVITKYEDIKLGNKYFIDENSLSQWKPKCETKPIKSHFLQYACENALYNIVRKKCKNVYICSEIFYNNDTYYNRTHNDLSRKNFLINRDLFPENFANDICGKDEEYLCKVIQDRANCDVIRLNDFYYTFSSNYRSTYFNTNLYGNRMIKDTPEKYIGTIYLYGACLFSGYAVEDNHTVGSYLQSSINISQYKYRVEDLSFGPKGPNKLLEVHFNLNDIIIMRTLAFFQVKEIIPIKFNEINDLMQGKRWFWDTPKHMGCFGYKFLADKIFKAIEPVMKENKNAFNYKFYLDNDLECKIEKYINNTKNLINKDDFYKILCDMQEKSGNNKRKSKTGAIVMNCNPFTYGHQYLIDTASRLVDILYIFVVEEDKSTFPFNKRFSMVKEGIKDYSNVIVLPSGSFMISSVTFPGYFLKDTPSSESYDDFTDLKIFAHYIAPAFGIDVRFVGEEPFDMVTAQYNSDMKVILKEVGITVIEIPRKKCNNEYISATKVRKLLKEKNYTSLKNYVPETTISILELS